MLWRKLLFEPHGHRLLSHSSGFAGTFAGSVRRVIAGNCCCYYWDCCTHCCWGWHTEPCPQEDLDSECRTEEQRYFQRRQVDTRLEGAGDAEEVVRGHQLLVASVRKQGLRGRPPRERVAARRLGVALRQLSVQPLPPSSSPSTLS